MIGTPLQADLGPQPVSIVPNGSSLDVTFDRDVTIVGPGIPAWFTLDQDATQANMTSWTQVSARVLRLTSTTARFSSITDKWNLLHLPATTKTDPAIVNETIAETLYYLAPQRWNITAIHPHFEAGDNHEMRITCRDVTSTLGLSTWTMKSLAADAGFTALPNPTYRRYKRNEVVIHADGGAFNAGHVLRIPGQADRTCPVAMSCVSKYSATEILARFTFNTDGDGTNADWTGTGFTLGALTVVSCLPAADVWLIGMSGNIVVGTAWALDIANSGIVVVMDSGALTPADTNPPSVSNAGTVQPDTNAA